jgi:hypothetical protein
MIAMIAMIAIIDNIGPLRNVIGRHRSALSQSLSKLRIRMLAILGNVVIEFAFENVGNTGNLGNLGNAVIEI